MSRSRFDWDGRAATLEDQLGGVFAITGDMGIDFGGAVARVSEDTNDDVEFRSGVIVFSDGRFHNLGVGYENGRMEDVGRYGVSRKPQAWGAFITPSLNNVALTAPYMHDGSLATLQDVVAFYAQGGLRNRHIDDVIVRREFTDQDRADLVAFLRALTTDWRRGRSHCGHWVRL